MVDISYTVKIDAANKRGGKKYLKQINADNARWVLDKDAIEKSSRLDGYYAIQTRRRRLIQERSYPSIMIYGR